MRANTFNHSLLAIGVAAVLGMSTTTNAVETPQISSSVVITNQATANYKVAGQDQPVVESNIVKVTVTEQVSFSLVPTDNVAREVAPKGFVQFTHTLKNTGNRTDTYAITTPTAPDGYDTANSSISYKIYDAKGTEDESRAVTDAKYGASSGRVFPLEKGHYIVFVINAKTTGNKGGETKTLEVSAASTILGVDRKLVNTDTSFTRLPTFNIIKTITNGLDLNDANDTATYQVVVTNDGNTLFTTDATDIAIADFLPDGLVMAEALKLGDIKPSGDATKGIIDTSNAGAVGSSGFNITGINIPVGQNVQITFKVKKGPGTLTPETAINHVTVTDNLDNRDDTDNTLVDSTDFNKEVNVGAFYTTTQINNLKGETPANPGDDSTLPLSLGGTISRFLTLTGVTTREIAPTSGTAGQVTHTTVITNTGKDNEGSKAGELTFTITDNDGNTRDAINAEPDSVTVTYYPTGDATTTAEPTVVNKKITAVNGVYDISTALPGGIAPNGTVTINYNVSSVGAEIFTPEGSTTPTVENTTVTLIPAQEGAPKPLQITDKTTVRGLVLLKTQAIDADCTGTPAADKFTSDDIVNVSPGQCIVYKVKAQNTSSALPLGFGISDVTILDEFIKFSAKADYVEDSVTATTNGVGAVTPTANPTNVTTKVTTLAPQETATMQFKVKIKTGAGIVTPPVTP